MSRDITDRALALAGLLQAVQLVQRIAQQGPGESEALRPSLESLFVIDAPDTAAVFGGAANVAPGLRLLQEQLKPTRSERDMELARYVVALLHLQKKLAGRRELIEAIRNGIARIERQRAIFGVVHENVVAALADLYSETVSTLTPRIMVSGDPAYLENPANANRVRALLLAGVRAAMLWRQSGGSRLKLLFNRSGYLAAVHHCLAEA